MYSAIAANKRNTVFIMAVFVGVVAAVGWAISYAYGYTYLTPWIVAGAGVYALIQYYAADKLAVAMTGAQQIEKRDNSRLWRVVENLAITNGMPMPRVYIVNDPAPNAFATGRDRDHALVAATTGLLELMSDRELEGVMAHEMGHVKNYDIRVSMIAFGLASAIGILSDIALHMMWFGDRDNRQSNPIMMLAGVAVIILAPIVAALIQAAISRQREYLADATGALTTRDPEGLASALEKLKNYTRPMQRQSTATAHLFFANPLKAGALTNMFSTHPPIDERIARLQEQLTKM
jgi:heat shock protein HtpX